MKKRILLFGLAVCFAIPCAAQTLFEITTPPTLPNGRVGVPYSLQLQATGGPLPYRWTVVPIPNSNNPGALPPGLTLSIGGLISGTPATGGNYIFQVRVTGGDSVEPPSRFRTFTLTIDNPPPVVITTASPLPNATVGVPYNVGFTATGGYAPYTWFHEDYLPPGLSLLSVSGTLAGTPTETGTYEFEIAVDDKDGVYATKRFTLTVTSGITITNTGLPAGSVGQPYNATLTASGGSPPYTWSILQGTLPPGLSLSASTGAITGTPTAAGIHSFNVRVLDARQATATRDLSINISASALTITTSSLPNGTTGQSYSATLAASGGTGPYTWSIAQGALPAGLSLNTSSGAITGTPTVAGASTFTARVTDASQANATRELSITVTSPAGPLVIVTDALPRGATGEPYSFALTASGGTQPYRWAMASGSLPSGIILDPAGVLSGIPEQAGTASFFVRVTDAREQSTERSLSLEVAIPQEDLRFSTQTLVFEAFQGGDAPPVQYLSIIAGTQIREFVLQADAGTNGSAAPAWLVVSQLRGSTPARIGVAADHASLIPGRYTARITTFDGGQQLVVNVRLDVAAEPRTLEVAPSIVNFAGTSQSLATAEQSIVIRNSGGGGAFNVTLQVPSNAPWLTVAPSTGVVAPNAVFIARLRVNPGTRVPSAYTTQLRVVTPAGNSAVTVNMLIRGTSPAIGLEYSSVRFTVREGQGAPAAQVVNVLNSGEGSLNWNAEVLGVRWLSLSPAAGISTQQVGTPMSMVVSPGGLARGVHQALVRITSSQAPNSPQYLIVVLQVLDPIVRPEPEFFPSGVVFSAIPGTTPATERVRLSASTASSPFQATPTTRDGAPWLQVSPAVGNVSTGQPITMNLSVTPTGLAPGLYRGEVAVALGGFPVRSINVTLLVPRVVAASQTRAAASGPRELAGCTPDRLVLTHTALPGSFSVPAAAPVPIAVTVRDNCQDPVGDASVVVKFSNGDPALPLRVANRQRGTYTGVWIPGVVRDTVTVRAEATSPTLGSGNSELAGGTSARLPLPSLSPGGIVSAFNPVGGGVLAPGSVIELYGTELATATAQPTTVPLPTAFNGVTVLVGDKQAPLFYTSSGQTNIQIPFESDPGREYAVLYNVNGALAVSSLTLSPVQPALLGFAQRTDGTFVSPGAPASPGEVLVLYLVGLGVTNPRVESGAASPGVEPLGRVVSDVSVMIGDQNAELFFQGLTPPFVGLYQVNLRVPADLATGEYDVVVKSEGRDSNVFRLPVRR